VLYGQRGGRGFDPLTVHQFTLNVSYLAGVELSITWRKRHVMLNWEKRHVMLNFLACCLEQGSYSWTQQLKFSFAVFGNKFSTKAMVWEHL